MKTPKFTILLAIVFVLLFWQAWSARGGGLIIFPQYNTNQFQTNGYYFTMKSGAPLTNLALYGVLNVPELLPSKVVLISSDTNLTSGDVDLGSQVSGILATNLGGTGLATIGTAGQVLTATASGLAYSNIVGIAGGTVTSVGLTAPNIFTVTGTPVTTSGTIDFALTAWATNNFLGGPGSGGSPGVPSPRPLVEADIPTFDISKIVSGILNTNFGGTGLGTIGTAGQVLTSTGSELVYSNLPTTLGFSAPTNELVFGGGAGLTLMSLDTPTINDQILHGRNTANGGTPYFGFVNLVGEVTGSLKVTNGGTGFTTSGATGDLIIGSGNNTAYNRLADVATNQVLLSGGVNVSPAYGYVGLTAHVRDILGGTNGGTGLNTFGSAGQILTSTGTAWGISNAPTGGGGSGVSGSGTIGTLPIWVTSTTNLGDSVISQTGTNALVAGNLRVQKLSVSQVVGTDASGYLASMGTLSFADGGTGEVNFSTNGLIYSDGTKFENIDANATATKKYLQSVNGGPPTLQQVDYADLSGTPPAGGSGVSGSGTVGTVPLWTTNSTNLSDSIIVQSATNQVDVTGTVNISESLGVEMVVNGNFVDGSGWTTNTGWLIAGGVASHLSAGTGTLTQTAALTPVVGSTYKIQYTVSNWTVAGMTVTFGGVVYQANTMPITNGVHTAYVTASTTGSLIFTPTSTSRFDIDNVTIKLINSGISSTTGTTLFGHKMLSDPVANEVAYCLHYNVNKSGGNDTGLLINMIDVVSPGTSKLLALQVASSDVVSFAPNGTMTTIGGMTASGNITTAGSMATTITTTTTPTIGLWTSAAAASSGTPIRISPSVVWSSTGWNTNVTAASKVNAVEAYVLPQTGSNTSGALIFANRTVDGNANATELFRADQATGNFRVFNLSASKYVVTDANTNLVSGLPAPGVGSGVGSLTNSFTDNTSIYSLTVASGVVVHVEAKVLFKDNNEPSGGSTVMTGTFENNAGTLTQCSGTSFVHQYSGNYDRSADFSITNTSIHVITDNAILGTNNWKAVVTTTVLP